jgi:hypothetical protein
MAATGTGTAADPYVVDNWTDFLTVCNVSASTYILWANKETEEEKVVDFNDIAPYGLETQIQLRGHIDFNGWTLQNVWVRNSNFLYLNSVRLYNLKILNAKADSTSSTSFVNIVDSYQDQGDIENLEISLEIIGSSSSTFNVINVGAAYTKTKGLGLSVYGTATSAVAPINSQTTAGVSVIASSIHCELQANLSNNVNVLNRAAFAQCDISGYYLDDSSSTSPIVVGGTNSSCNYIRLRSNKDIKYGGNGLSLRVDENYTGEIVRPNLLTAEEKALVVSPTQAINNQIEILNAGFPLHAEITG